MDYNAEMLKLYFKEMNYSVEEIKELLNNNPFDETYYFWEQDKIKENISFSKLLKFKKLIKPEDKIEEIVVHEDNSVSKYLENDSIFAICPVDGNINNVRISNNLILMKGFFPNQANFIKKLSKYSIPFIAGTTTIDTKFYNYMLKYYKYILEAVNNLELLEFHKDILNTCLIKRK